MKHPSKLRRWWQRHVTGDTRTPGRLAAALAAAAIIVAPLPLWAQLAGFSGLVAVPRSQGRPRRADWWQTWRRRTKGWWSKDDRLFAAAVVAVQTLAIIAAAVSPLELWATLAVAVGVLSIGLVLWVAVEPDTPSGPGADVSQ